MIGFARFGAAAPWREAAAGWAALRNRLLMDRRFQSFAARFPLTRPIARRRARALFDLSAGFVYSQVVAACVQSRLLERLADGPQPAASLAQACALRGEAFDRLARAAASLGLLEREDARRWRLGPQGAALLGNPGLPEMIAHHAMLYTDLADPLALLRGERPSRLNAFWPYAGDRPGDAAPYSSLMAASQPMIAAQALEALPLGAARTLLDVGGGEGAFAIAAAQRARRLNVIVFDLPEVAERARRRLGEAGLGGRAQAIAGDFRADPLPCGADLVTLVRVLHDHNDDAALTLLRKARQALAPGGRLAIIEPLADTRGCEPAGDAYFGIYLLAMGSGRPRSRTEHAALLRQAGFGAIREPATPLPLLARVLLARPRPAPREEIDRTTVESN